MIAVSDVVLILVSAAALGSGLYRWQGNIEQATLANSRPAVSSTADPNIQTSDANRQISNANGEQVMSSQNGTSPAVQGNVSGITSSTTIDRSGNDVIVANPVPTVTIDVSEDVATTASNNAVADIPPYGSYLVKSGDSLSLIAQQYGTTVGVLQDINGIEGTLITVGQQLRYPLPVN